ncbi:hypothetical protein JCM17846_30660 [Iodidimonas nitroreducens]|uniref:DUF2336 domain-containing protein n=1 Tax=Iodidimonas nitroreducens TaxID=1236968 RepID=A0A5A7NCD6_9PROT|nr:DUF2336 domain-containing protein [Iodidimonas nitroreducens]GAK33334.1 hypothetical protein AQ1_01222 [alpha proteobacterium Q-1]GER05384.1 hypothetical protein JCM17846_30660 [Iodidimonas nitroreducens]
MGDRIHDLVTLAREKTAEGRRKLFENMTDLFLSEEGRLSEHERALMSDILAKLIRTVEKSLRQELAEFFARTDIDLPDIVRLLSNDEIEVARPLLEKSRLLRDEDLVEIIKMRTDEHRLAIALRDELSEDVANALVEYGNSDVIETLLRNADASLSQRAMEYLVAESRRNDRFQEPLVNRDDLPSELAYRMYWWVAASLRKRILSEFDVDPLVIDEAMRQASRGLMAQQQSLEGTYLKAQRLVRRLSETGDLTIEFLMGSLRQRRIAVFVAGLAELGGIDFRTAWRIFSDRGGESLAVLAKAIGMERSQFTSVYLLISQARDGGRARGPGVLKRILELFDQVSAANARGALQYWQRDSAYQMALEELQNV